MRKFFHFLFHTWDYEPNIGFLRECRFCDVKQQLFVMGSVGVGIEENWIDMREWDYLIGPWTPDDGPK